MEAAELSAKAVEVLTAVATGAATRFGEGAGTAVSDLVRARLGGTDRGRAALERLDADGGVPAAQSEADAVLREELETDPELRRQLAVHLSAPSTHIIDSMVISGSRMSHNTISLGPLTVNNTPGNRASLLLAAILLLVVLALGLYGGVQIITSDDTPSPQPTPSQRSSTRALSVAETLKTLPTLDSMPRGWRSAGGPGVSKAERAGACHSGRAEYRNPATYVHAEFSVYACTSPRQASAGFRELVREQYGYSRTTRIPLPRMGEESTALTYYKSEENNTHANAVVRVGSVVVWLRYGTVDDEPDYEAQLQQLTSMAVGRIQRVVATGDTGGS
ncbi:hypothetical protein [Streptomyces chattanoogensis]|uniref:hypothetical protein n=1 Tax=Streptomyces chattanoogensis TaxID=66876 RepID=UPI00367D1824